MSDKCGAGDRCNASERRGKSGGDWGRAAGQRELREGWEDGMGGAAGEAVGILDGVGMRRGGEMMGGSM